LASLLFDTKGIVKDKLDIKNNLDGKRDRVQKVQLDKSERLKSIEQLSTAEELIEFMAIYREESLKINDKDNFEITKQIMIQLENTKV